MGMKPCNTVALYEDLVHGNVHTRRLCDEHIVSYSYRITLKAQRNIVSWSCPRLRTRYAK